MNQDVPFQLRHDKKGRGIFSTRAFSPGDIILPFTPTILIPSLSHIKTICSHCFKPADVRSCSGCHAVSYCDAACQSANWTAVHSKECKLLRKVTEQGHPGIPTPVRAVIQALVKPGIGAALENLEGNVESWRKSDKWADMEMMAMGATAFTGQGTGQEELQKTLALLCKASLRRTVWKQVDILTPCRFRQMPFIDMMPILDRSASFSNQSSPWPITPASPMPWCSLLAGRPY